MNRINKRQYALQAMLMLARNYDRGALSARAIANQEQIPDKFLQGILLELTNAELLISVRGAKGGYLLRRRPSHISLGEIVRITEGANSPFTDAVGVRSSTDQNEAHRPLFEVFRSVRDAAATILENTSLADLLGGGANPRKNADVD